MEVEFKPTLEQLLDVSFKAYRVFKEGDKYVRKIVDR